MSSPSTVNSIYGDPTKKKEVEQSINKYTAKYADQRPLETSPVGKEEVAKDRFKNASSMTAAYFDLATDFYEYGYGQCFHFTPIYDGKPFEECLADYEREAGKLIRAKPGMKILDVGCGVGGPARQIARTFGSSVVGLNNNGYQIERARIHTRTAKLNHLCSYIEDDFCDMKGVEESSFDASFSFEATPHGNDLAVVYKEIYRALKPGSLFVDVTWCVTDDYDPKNPDHLEAINGILYGNSLPVARTEQQVIAAMRDAGFEVMEFRDLARDGDWPWYHVLENHTCCSFKHFRMTTAGRVATNWMLAALEAMSLVPKGTAKVSRVLDKGATSLVKAGRLGIYTTQFRCLGRKPL